MFVFSVSYQKAFQAAKAERANLPLVDILLSDREKQLSRGRRTIKDRTHDDEIILDYKRDKRLTEGRRRTTSKVQTPLIEETASAVCAMPSGPETTSTFNSTSGKLYNLSTASAINSSCIDHMATAVISVDSETFNSDQTTLTNLPYTPVIKDGCNTTLNLFRPFRIEEKGIYIHECFIFIIVYLLFFYITFLFADDATQNRYQMSIITTNAEIHAAPIIDVLGKDIQYPHGNGKEN